MTISIGRHILELFFQLALHVSCYNKLEDGGAARHKRFQCSVCIRDFASIEGLRLHEDLHKGRYRYHCGKGFSVTTNQ